MRATDLVTVRLADGRTGLLDMTVARSRVWADVLASLRDTGQPAYLEIDPKTSLITEFLMPLRTRVGEIAETPDGDLDVELIESHARHFVRRSDPDFEGLRSALETARKTGRPVIVTETDDSHEIFHVQSGGDS